MSDIAPPTNGAKSIRVKLPEENKSEEEEVEEKMQSVSARSVPASLPTVEAPFILCPLMNLGNTCYFNAGVQLLANCTPFAYGLRNSPLRHPSLGPRARKLCCTGGAASEALFQTFAQLLYDMEFARLRQGEALCPLKALDCLAAVHPAFEGRGQQDCPEMVNVIVANLSEEGRQKVELEALLRSFEDDAVALAVSDVVALNNVSLMLPPEGVDVRSVTQENAAGMLVSRESRKLYSSTETEKHDGLLLPSSSCYCSTQKSISLPLFPGSWWTYNTLRLMQTVNYDNEQLERKEKARRNEPYRNTFSPPKLHYNGVTDCFTGHLLSEVQCHTCGSTSRIVEEFSSLTIDVASYSQRRQYARRHPETQRVAEDRLSVQQKSRGSFQWWNPFAWIGALTRYLLSFFRGFTHYVDYCVTLKECLDIHFDPVVLKGNNKYHCSSCNTLSEATKRESLLSLPEYLLLQMKRFEYGSCFNTKKTDPVLFPVSWEIGAAAEADVLRLGDYMYRGVSRSTTPAEQFQRYLYTDVSTSATEAATKPGNVQHTLSSATEGTEVDSPGMLAPIHTYTLESVVNHHGSIMGGHYTAYAHKKTEDEFVWLSLNDEEILRVGVNEVENSEEYLLLYKKQPLNPHSEAVLSLRQKAKSLLSVPPAEEGLTPEGKATLAKGGGTRETNADEVVYISRPWLQRMAFMEEPGPILNRLCYCTGGREDDASTLNLQEPGSDGRSCHTAGSFPVEWFYVPLQRDEYNAFYSMYGGNRPVQRGEYEALCRAQHEVV
ncbi:putative ubiqitin hydrolase [Trypanosoma rangeli]|uniref:Putative ubiqitin hydrolase n=1 Tax=Trypanosoma rangeli TaxID=5698 RepID=A0A3R7NJI0_TRYRA|nr:putative ubiqitin hydrolase [Trypanosoma rangeli]RNF03509.1 putative ubiqitin hydrolase [Trypanosoma rangeli]|eukprot:RNF03509.1 putative ubiqitin hydrolase [Trypanosoma rangeli]